MSAWLGVASADHVRRGVSLGIAPIGHGKRSGLARMRPGDALIYYSPVERLGDRRPLRQFTAIGTVADGEIWRADEADFKPHRRRVAYEPEAHPVPPTQVRAQLHLTSQPNWGYQLRRGLVELDEHDAELVATAARATV